MRVHCLTVHRRVAIRCTEIQVDRYITSLFLYFFSMNPIVSFKISTNAAFHLSCVAMERATILPAVFAVIVLRDLRMLP